MMIFGFSSYFVFISHVPKVLGHDSMPFAVPIRIPDPAAFGALG
jgi:hypothetical protein